MKVRLGYNNEEDNIYIDLSTHLLIAGETGSGKSVAMNGLILTTMKKNPNAHFCLIDFKMIEFNRYRRLLNVHTTIEEIHAAISHYHRKMMERYQIMMDNDTVEYPGDD